MSLPEWGYTLGARLRQALAPAGVVHQIHPQVPTQGLDWGHTREFRAALRLRLGSCWLRSDTKAYHRLIRDDFGAELVLPDRDAQQEADLRVPLGTGGRARGHGHNTTRDRYALAYNVVRTCPAHESHRFRGQRGHDADHDEWAKSEYLIYRTYS